MKKKNSSELAYDRDNFISDFIGCECFQNECNSSKFDESIEQINAMINYCIDIKDEEEISFWRKLLQQTKVAKRRAKMIENNNTKEFALT